MGFDPEHYRIVKEASEKRERVELVNAQLEGADLSNAYLISAKLNGANLRNATLNGADLTNARLRRSDLRISGLRKANLNYADLGGADLRNADLRESDLTETELVNADLSNANLVYVNIVRANLKNAIFHDALFGMSRIDYVDISQAKGLETTKHILSSTIGFETLSRLEGKYPRKFLRGCGLPDSLISFLPSFIDSLNPIDFYSCFISYSHQDKSFAQRLHNDLQAKGIRCWLDDHDLKYGDDIYAGVDRGIRLWDKVILCASENSLKSGWVEREVDTAIEMELKHKKDTGESVLKIIPINLDGSLLDWTGKHAADLRRRLAGDFVDWDIDNEKYEKNFERLVKALNPDQPEPPEPRLFPP